MTLRLSSILAFVLLFLAVMGFVLRETIIASSYTGMAFQIAGVALMLWARATFGSRSFHLAANPTQGGLVTSGPYRFIRHPIYASLLCIVWAAALTHISIIDISLAVIATIATAIRIVAEEHLVVTMYPEYADYAARTKRILPFII
jgi:protein-S-isoprenylcysteine O-methyltransferase Ste14